MAAGHHGNACTIHMLNHQHQVHYLSVPLVLIIMLPLIPRDLHSYGSAEALHYSKVAAGHDYSAGQQ